MRPFENKLHWVLGVAFGEDLSRKPAGFAAQNFSLLNRIALNLLKQETSLKRGIKGKRLKAAWDHASCSNCSEFDIRRPWGRSTRFARKAKPTNLLVSPEKSREKPL